MKKAFTYTGLFAAGAVVCGVALKTMGDPSSVVPNAKAKEAVLASLTTATRPTPRGAGDSVVADAAAKLEPAIVDVHTVGKTVSSAQSPFDGDPIFRRFFGGGSGGSVPRSYTPQGAGSGVIISPDGYIMTNDHVIANTQSIRVTVGEDKEHEYKARLIGTDPLTDIAIIKIDGAGKQFPAAQLGNSDDLRVGDWAIAVGNPLDIGTTVTLGIISAKDRKDLSAQGGRTLSSRIQTDAAINPGNSGGALANINGQVIGINEAIYSPTGSYVGIGFAIPINDAKKIAAELIQNGKASHPYLGVHYGSVSALTPEARQKFGIPTNLSQGVIIATDPNTNSPAVYPNSPASRAGLRMNDVILEANGQKITNRDMLQEIIQQQPVGGTLRLSVLRDGQPRTINVTLAERPSNFGQDPQAQQQEQPQEQGNPFLQAP